MLICTLEVLGISIVAEHFTCFYLIRHFFLAVFGVTGVRSSVVHFDASLSWFFISCDKVVDSHVDDVAANVVDELLISF